MSDSLHPAASVSRRARPGGSRALGWLACGVAAACVLPMLAVAIAAFTGGSDTVVQLMQTVMPRYARATLALVALA